MEIKEHGAVRQTDGRLVISCAKCGSIGVSHVVDMERVSTLQNEEALKAFSKRVQTMHSAHEAQHVALVKMKQQGKDVSEQLAALDQKIAANLTDVAKSAPKDTSYTKVKSCPWCKEPINVTVQEQAV